MLKICHTHQPERMGQWQLGGSCRQKAKSDHKQKGSESRRRGGHGGDPAQQEGRARNA
jgi:hypothetical protein